MVKIKKVHCVQLNDDDHEVQVLKPVKLRDFNNNSTANLHMCHYLGKVLFLQH